MLGTGWPSPMDNNETMCSISEGPGTRNRWGKDTQRSEMGQFQLANFT